METESRLLPSGPDYFYHPQWPVLYEDNHLLGLYKPSGLLAQGDKSGQVSLLDLGKTWLKKRYNKPGNVFLGLVHRLDRPVAGAMMFARTSKAAARLSEQFRAGEARKTYLAVVQGQMKAKNGRLVNYLQRGLKTSTVKSAPSEGGKEARLSFRVLDITDESTLVEVLLETGRRHQIRAQLAHAGHPILGDVKYGARMPLPGRHIALLGRKLCVCHPTRQAEIEIVSPMPREWPWPRHDGGDPMPPWDWRKLVPLNLIQGEGR